VVGFKFLTFVSLTLGEEGTTRCAFPRSLAKMTRSYMTRCTSSPRHCHSMYVHLVFITHRYRFATRM